MASLSPYRLVGKHAFAESLTFATALVLCACGGGRGSAVTMPVSTGNQVGGSGPSGPTGTDGQPGSSGTFAPQGASGALSSGVSTGSPGTPGASGAPSPTPTSGATPGADSGAANPDGAGPPNEAGRLADTGTNPGITDPGSSGDGDRTIGPGFAPAPETTTHPGVPKGRVISFILPAGTTFPAAPSRNVRVYIPAQYVSGTPAPLMVVQDGMDSFYGFVPLLSTVLDNLINAKKVPAIVLVLPDNGGGDYIGSERGLEYDTVSGLYADWAEKELLPATERATMTQLPSQAVTFTRDPQGRGSIGGSSGGAASFSMAWWHPDLFRRVLTFSGTYVNQVPSTSPFPHGCWVYHDVDPYAAAAPNGLIVQNCQAAGGFTGMSAPGPCDTPLTAAACQAVMGCAWNTTINRPIRIWHESGSNDLGAAGAPSTYRNFDLANQRMAAAFKLRGYHYHYDHAIGAGHVDPGAMRQTIAEALVWLWRGYP